MALVALVGRPNVGKSTLFNRLTEVPQAIVHDAPGITRDRIYGHVEWNGRRFSLVDTGGFVPNSAERFERAIREQVHIAIDEADVVLMVTDVMAGVTDLDQDMAHLLRRSHKPVMVLGNKADNMERRYQAASLYALGLGEVYPVSGTNGMGTGDFLDALVDALPAAEDGLGHRPPRSHRPGRPPERGQVAPGERAHWQGPLHRDRSQRHHAGRH